MPKKRRKLVVAAEEHETTPATATADAEHPVSPPRPLVPAPPPAVPKSPDKEARRSAALALKVSEKNLKIVT